METVTEILEDVRRRGECEPLEYLVRNSDFVKFKEYGEFERYREQNSMEDLVKNKTVFDTYDEMLRYGRQELVASEWYEKNRPV